MEIAEDRSIDDLWKIMLTDVLEEGNKLDSRAGGTMEILGGCYRLNDIKRNFLFNKRRMLDPCYAAAETLWYLSGSESISMLKKFAPQYERFALPGGRFTHGAYGPRIMAQLHNVVHVLKHKQNTRQACIAIFEQRDTEVLESEMVKDIPCTLSLNFIVRDNKLNLITTMRSNDLWLGTPYDIFAFSTIQRFIADYLKIGYGFYQHNVCSLHLYERNIISATESLDFIGLDKYENEIYFPYSEGYPFDESRIGHFFSSMQMPMAKDICAYVVELFSWAQVKFFDVPILNKNIRDHINERESR